MTWMHIYAATPTFINLVTATYNSVCEMCHCFKPVVKTTAASTRSDDTASTSEDPAAKVNMLPPQALP